MAPYILPAHEEAHFWDRVLQRFHMNNFLSPSVNQEWWEAGFLVIISKHLLGWGLALHSPVVFYNCSHPLQSSEMTVLSIALANTELKTLWHWQVSAVWFYLRVYFRSSLSCFGAMSHAQLKCTAVHSSQKEFLNIYAYTLRHSNVHIIKPAGSHCATDFL